MSNELALELMNEFAEATGVSGTARPRRYLWTDAFAVCNFLGLYRATGNDRYLELALELVDQVHHILGRHRSDDPRCGWISGLSENDGERHPTLGGLRIGKKLNERGEDQPPDPRLEWDQDGQYFHYVTKWMHALYRVNRETGEKCYLRWAAELALTAHRSFTYETSPHGPKRMFWKMSIDLSRPLVSSMGHHDPLDGLITFLELQTSKDLEENDAIDLTPAIADMTTMCAHGHWATKDSLGIGGLLDDAARLTQMVGLRGVERRDLLVKLLGDIGSNLRTFSRSTLLQEPATHRMAFRELGLSIGLHGLDRMAGLVAHDRELAGLVQYLTDYRSMGERIELFWSEPLNRQTNTWQDHREINTVMLAMSLALHGYLKP